ncbi:MAG: PQQ-binding-like beta-propeller repeat protein, partial [Lentisphaeria bacterium]|nr:PQQ-binding-like beta-propeller repeat protein [Lentisphaeria bacterium]
DRLIVHGSAMDGVEGSVYALALESGRILWRSPARSRVVGSLATDDGKYALAVRSEGRLDQTGHWLGCWTVRTGRMVWEYSRPDTVLNQIPVYDHATRRVVAYFDDGTIVGLDVHSGELLWERRLYQGPLVLPAFHWQPSCYDSLQQIPGMVLATDRTGDVTVLSTSTGDILASYQAAERIVEGVRTGRRSLVAKPWQIGSQLVVCGGTEICSYRFPLDELQRAAAACRPTVESIDYERRIPEWIEQLGAPVAADRMAARKLLLRAGEIAFEELQTRRDDPDPEIRAQVREILEALE